MTIISNLNKNSDLYLILQELEDVKTLLANGSLNSGSAATTSGDNLFVQYPESTSEMELAASGTYEREVTINLKLKQLSVSIPEGVFLTIYNDNNVLAWFSNEAGTMENMGISFGVMKIVVENTTAESQRWTMKAVFG